MSMNGLQELPQDMGSLPNSQEMSSADMPDMNDGGDKSDSEINDIFNQLDTEKQAAVIKYAKSMVDNKSGNDESQPDVNEEQIVNEITNNILDDRKDENNDNEEKIRNKKITNSNPFISKNFQKKR